MSKANETQVGGTHYKGDGKKVEHWDLAIMYNWDPFQYQITKYVMRWKDKHATTEKRLEDLKKAVHFLEKYIENWRAYDVRQERAVEITTAPNGWLVEGFYGDMTQMYKCPACHEYIRAMSMSHALEQHKDCAGAPKMVQC